MAFDTILNFLEELKENNNRDWFTKNKNQFITVKQEFEIQVEILIREIAKFDKDIGALQAKDCIFRIYRDVRFSKDKSPYKTNFGAFMVPGGKKSGNAGYYIHIDPGTSFLAGGVHLPPSDILKKIRLSIFEHTDEFKSILNSSGFKQTYGNINGDKLKTAPKGFPKEFPDIDLIQFKSYTVVKEVSKSELLKDNFLTQAAKTFKILSPYNQFLNHAINE